MTGSFNSRKVKVVPSAPSKVTRDEPDFDCKCCAGGSSETLSTSMWTLPRAPSPQIATRCTLFSLLAVGQTEESSAQVVANSPVAELHLSENSENGMRISVKSSPAGTVKGALKQPR